MCIKRQATSKACAKQAANYLKKIGEFYAGEAEDELAAQYFRQAAELYGVTKYHVTDMQKLNVKVADMYAVMFGNKEKLKEAIKVSLADIRGHGVYIHQQQSYAFPRKNFVL